MTDKVQKITGGCLCGVVKYEADQPPFDAGYCHCRMCQKSLGGLFGSWVFIKHADFCFVAGEPKWYKSSEVARRAFCADCGSPVAYQPEGADFITIWIGTLDDPEAVEPRGHWHTESKISWVDIHENLPDGGAVFEAES